MFVCTITGKYKNKNQETLSEQFSDHSLAEQDAARKFLALEEDVFGNLDNLRMSQPSTEVKKTETQSILSREIIFMKLMLLN